MVAEPACSVYVRSTSMPTPRGDVTGAPSRNTIWAAVGPRSWADASSTCHVPVDVRETPSTVTLKSLDAGPAHERALAPEPSTRAAVTIPPVGPVVMCHLRCTRASPSTAVAPSTDAVTASARAGATARTAGTASSAATASAVRRRRAMSGGDAGAGCSVDLAPGVLYATGRHERTVTGLQADGCHPAAA